MRLQELFASLEKEQDHRLDPEINYLADLKFFIDNDNDILSKFFFPAIKQHKDTASPDDYHHYVEPIKKTIVIYCKKHDLDDVKDDIFGEDDILELAKRMAQEQHRYIDRGDYE
jgi:glycosylphosphatidylinositol transamidase (GPIT) subunit GPI8